MHNDNEQMNDNQNSYIPTIKDWTMLYGKWYGKLVKSLWQCGNSSECQEAVQEAFLKVMGLSDHLHLKKPLTPKTDGEWYGFIRYQAKGILSHYHEYANRFVEVKDWSFNEDASNDEDDWDNEGEEENVQQVEPDDSLSFELWLQHEVRKVVREVCHEAGVSQRNLDAFTKVVLDELDGKTVVKKMPSIHNENNLYQITNRVMKRLKASSSDFAYIYDELNAA